MDADRFDSVAKTLAAPRSRRTMLRAAAGVIAGLATARFAPMRAQAADPVPPIPAPSLTPWPPCSGAISHYCVAEFTADGVDQLSSPTPEYQVFVYGTGSLVGATVADRLEFLLYRTDGDLQLKQTDLDTQIVLKLHAGQLEPVSTHMRGVAMSMRKTGDGVSGWDLEYRGRPSIQPGYYDASGLEHSQFTWFTFQSLSLCRNSSMLGGWSGYEGYMASANVSGSSPPSWINQGWHVNLMSPHLAEDGSVLHGSYAAWMTAGTVQRMGLTIEQAIAGGMTVTRRDGGLVSDVPASISERDGGLFIEIPDLTFSSPTIVLQGPGGGGGSGQGPGPSESCAKGRSFKNGRCVKKKTGKGKGKGKGQGSGKGKSKAKRRMH